MLLLMETFYSLISLNKVGLCKSISLQSRYYRQKFKNLILYDQRLYMQICKKKKQMILF